MLRLASIVIYLSITRADPCSLDGGFGALAKTIGSSKSEDSHNGLVNSLFGGDCHSSYGCNGAGSHNINCGCCKPCTSGCSSCGQQCPAFSYESLSESRTITPECLRKSLCQIRRLVSYLDTLSQGTQCSTNQYVESLMNHAQIYSMLFGKNVNKFSCDKASRARPVLRINEAIMSTLSRLAGLIKDMSSRMDAAGCSTGCDDTTDVAKKAAQSYFRLLGSLMGQVTNYLCTSPTSAINDPVLCSADQIAVMFLQLVPATVALLRSPCPYNGAMCHGTVHELKKQLDDMANISKQVEDSTPSTLKTALAMTQHYVMVLTYDAKLNQSDCTGGGRCLSSDNVDYPYEVSTVQKQKDKLFQTMSEKFDHHFRELDNKQALRDKFTQLIAADVQLFEAVSKRMCSGQCVTKLILQFLGTTKSALLTLEQNMVKPEKLGADSFKGLVEVAYETNMYTLHSLDLLGCDESEEIANDVGLNYLKLVMDGAQEVTKEKLNEKLALIKVLKSIVETPSCSGKNMPRGYLITSRSLIRAMTGAAQKLSELYSHADEETIVTSLNNLTEELIKVIKFSWSVLYRKHIGSCVDQLVVLKMDSSSMQAPINSANHDCFVRQYSRQLFENAKTMFSNYFPAAADNIPARIDAATKLLIAERDLLNTITGVSHTLRSDDTRAIGSIQQVLQKMLSSPLEQKEASKRIFESALGKLSPTSSDCHAALSTVLQAMIQVAQVNTA